MSATPELREIYEAEEKARMLEATQIRYAEEVGERRGERRGVQRGQQRVLQHQMSRRIGTVPENITASLDTLTPEQLDALSEALFDLRTFPEIETRIAAQTAS